MSKEPVSLRRSFILKDNVHPVENALDKVTHLRGVHFEWKDRTYGEGPQIGVIGQEVEQIFPEVVSTDDKGYKSVAYGKLVGVLVEAMKELKAENETLRARVDALATEEQP